MRIPLAFHISAFCSILLIGCSAPSESKPVTQTTKAAEVPTKSADESEGTTKAAETPAPQEPSIDAETPSELILYSLDFRERRIDPIADDDKRERFGDFLVLGKVKIEEAAKRKEIMESIHKAIPNSAEGPACFWPRHGLKIVDSKGTTEMVICFQCVQYTATGAHAIDGYGTISTAPKPLLNNVLKDAGIEIVPDDFDED